MFGGSSAFGTEPLAGRTPDSGHTDSEAKSPIVVELSGIDSRPYVAMDSVRIDDTLGQPVTARFTLLNGPAPQVGTPLRILYFSQPIFAGTIDHVTQRSPDLRTIVYEVQAMDHSHILLRRKLRRNFTNATVQSIVDSLLDNELAGEGLTIGTIDARSVLPLVDARDAKMFEVLRTVAGATGQTFYLDYDKSIQMRSATVPLAPLVLNEANTLLDGTTLESDAETYRNRQIVVVTGTPPTSTQDALTTSIQRDNADQIAARAALEGGTGIYEEIESITHPTSNDGAALALLGIGYANLRLATSGTPRLTFSCQALGYGFRAGQIATVALPTFGVSGTFVIQRVSIREKDGVLLFHTLELTNSSLQQRAYEAWLGIVKAGKVIVQVPSSLTNNLQSFTTPGADTFTVPAGITSLELTAYGGSGGGGGGAWSFLHSGQVQFDKYANGGKGGNSGKAVSVLSVTPGQVIDIIVGSAGLGGTSRSAQFPTPAQGDAGTDGTASQCKLGSLILSQGDGGRGGAGGYQNGDTGHNGANGTPGSGVGDAVSTGGGKTGGAKGTGSPFVNGHAGVDGLVEVRW